MGIDFVKLQEEICLLAEINEQLSFGKTSTVYSLKHAVVTAYRFGYAI